jgi:hypothetical protein
LGVSRMPLGPAPLDGESRKEETGREGRVVFA